MVLTLFELTILLDTLIGTLSIRDNGNLFNYSRDQRQKLVDSIAKRMHNTPINFLRSTDKKESPGD